MTVQRVAARAHARAQLDSPSPLAEFDLKRLDERAVTLPAAPEPAASPAVMAATAVASTYGLDLAVAQSLTVEELAILAAPKPAGDLTPDERAKLADKGAAMPDGSFPIRNATDLGKALHLVGNASDPAAAKAHVIARAKALNLVSQLPPDWKVT